MSHALRATLGKPLAFGALALIGAGLLWASPALNKHAVARPAAPEGAKILFAGKEAEMQENWVYRNSKKPAGWKIQPDGGMQVFSGDIITKESFLDYQLHIEFKTPLLPNAKGQARGNSGIGLQGRYEVQVLDSYGLKVPGKGDCGSIYGQAAPLLVASKPPKEWQTYDIVFRRPRFNEKGERVSKARVTVIHNGMVVQNNQEMEGATGIGKGPEDDKPAPIILQDHSNLVEYGNIWLVPLPDKGSNDYDGH